MRTFRFALVCVLLFVACGSSKVKTPDDFWRRDVQVVERRIQNVPSCKTLFEKYTPDVKKFLNTTQYIVIHIPPTTNPDGSLQFYDGVWNPVFDIVYLEAYRGLDFQPESIVARRDTILHELVHRVTQKMHPDIDPTLALFQAACPLG